MVVFIISLSAYCYAFDWKLLHEEADRTDLQYITNKAKQDKSIENLYILGLVRLNLHKDALASEAFNEILNLDPDNYQAKWGVAEVLRRQHSFILSERVFNDIIAKHPDFSPAYISLAYIKYLNCDFQGSYKLAVKVIEQGRSKVDISNFVRAYCIYAGNKGMIAHYGGPLSKVINGTVVLSTLKKAQALQPDSTAVLLGLGSFYLLAPSLAGGNIDNARQYLEKAVKIDPYLVDAYVRLAQVYKAKGDQGGYDKYMKIALDIDPKSPIALDIKSGKCRFICTP